MKENPPAVILGGRATVMPVARSLGRRGVRIYAAGGPADPIRHSRYCTSYAELTEDERFQERCLEWLKSTPRGGVVLPSSDDGVDLVARNRAALTELGYITYEADDPATLAMLDKAETYRLAREIGMRTPEYHVLDSVADVGAAIGRFAYPCCLKPRRAHMFAKQHRFRGKVLIAEDEDELVRLSEETVEHGLEMMVTEIIPGRDDQLYEYSTYIDDSGEPLFHFVERKLRQEPIHFGTGSYRVGEWNQEVAELGLRFCQQLGVRGVATVEFKRDARDGAMKLMECNNRFDGSLQLLRSSGIDVPWIVYDRALGRRVPPARRPRYGLRLWHPLPDVRALRSYRRERELTVAQWARSLVHVQRFPLFSWRDPKPTIVEQRRWIVDFVRRRLGALAASLSGRRSAEQRG